MVGRPLRGRLLSRKTVPSLHEPSRCPLRGRPTIRSHLMTHRLAACLALSAGLLLLPAGRAAEPKVPDGVTWEPNVEYSNPDGQHLMLDVARPSKGDGPFPAV